MKVVFTEAEQIVLKGIFGKSTENASLALEKMFNSKPKKYDFNLEFSSDKNRSSFLKNKDKVVATLLGFEGEVSGEIVMSLKEKDVGSKIFHNLFSSIDRQSKELVESAVGEVANIVVGAFFSALSDYCQINVLETTPNTVYDIWESIFKNISRKTKEEELLALNVSFEFDSDFKIFLFLFMKKSLSKKLIDFLKVHRWKSPQQLTPSIH